MTEDIRQHGIVYRICDSIPFLGKPITLIFDHTQDAVAEHGFVTGSVKGALVGIVIAIVMIASVEAVTAVFEVVREEVRLRWTAPMISDRRDAAEKRGLEEVRRNRIHRAESPEHIRASVTYYAVDKQGDAPIVTGELTPDGVIEFLDKFQRGSVSSNSLERLPIGAAVRPFFFQSGQHVAVMDVPAKGDCVFADFEDKIILIPMASYKASGLPMKGDVRHDKE